MTEDHAKQDLAPGTQTVHIVDDDDSFREAVARLLKTSGYSVKCYSSAGEFLLSPTSETGCILLDIRMPGPNGFELQQAIGKNGHSLPIIFLTGYGDIPGSVRAIKAGAIDFLTKPVKRETLLTAVNNAINYGKQFRAAAEEFQQCQASLNELTNRELEVFKLVVSGKLNKQIAGELGMAERTVKAHRAHVMDKMHATSLAELVHFSELLDRANSQHQNRA